MSWWHPFMTVNAAEFAVMGGCVAAWLACWRRIRKLGPVRRWALVAACGAVTLADVILFSKFIR
jgi:hypothetical protein